MKKLTILFIILITLNILSCKSEPKSAVDSIEESIETVDDIKKTADFEDVAFGTVDSKDAGFMISINKSYKDVLKAHDYIDFTKIEEGDMNEYKKLESIDTNNETLQKLYYGKCWDSRPKNFQELDYVETTRQALKQLNDTDISILNLFDIIGFKFNRKNRLYSSSVNFTGKHICNDRVFDYFISIDILYKVKLKNGSLKFTTIKDLAVKASAGKVEVEYFYKSKGIQLNLKADKAPDFSLISSGIFNEEAKIELDKKMDYVLNEISKDGGALIGRPFPKDFLLYIKE